MFGCMSSGCSSLKPLAFWVILHVCRLLNLIKNQHFQQILSRIPPACQTVLSAYNQANGMYMKLVLIRCILGNSSCLSSAKFDKNQHFQHFFRNTTSVSNSFEHLYQTDVMCMKQLVFIRCILRLQ